MKQYYFQMLKNWTQPEKLKSVCECNDITVIEIEVEDNEDQAQSD